MTGTISGQVSTAPRDRIPAAMFTAHRISDILTHLAHAGAHMQMMRKSSELRGYHGEHFDNHVSGAMEQAGQLKDNMLVHYPAEAAEWRRLSQVMNLAVSVNPAAKAATFSHLLQTIMYDGAHCARHAHAMLTDNTDAEWTFDADHAEKHLDGAREHALKLAGHIRDNYPIEWHWLHELVLAEDLSNISSQALLVVSISGQAAELGWESQLRDPRGRWATAGGALSHNVHPEGFSLHPRTGQSPTSGYMVSLPGHTHQYPDTVMKDEHELAAAIDHTLMSEREIFKKPGVYLGGWVSDGKLWLDPSENIADHDQAVKLGRGRNQVAIWDVQGGREIDTGGTGGDVTEHAAAYVFEDPGQLRRLARGSAQRDQPPAGSAVAGATISAQIDLTGVRFDRSAKI